MKSYRHATITCVSNHWPAPTTCVSLTPTIDLCVDMLDYALKTPTASFSSSAAGGDTFDVDVTILPDNMVEGQETFVLWIASGTEEIIFLNFAVIFSINDVSSKLLSPAGSVTADIQLLQGRFQLVPVTDIVVLGL